MLYKNLKYHYKVGYLRLDSSTVFYTNISAKWKPYSKKLEHINKRPGLAKTKGGGGKI